MRFAWFTPLSVKSAIGRASATIVRELSKAVDLDVFHSESGPTLSVEAKTVHFPTASALSPGRMAGYDLIFYNLGNHMPYHLEIYLASRRFPGVIVLHDFVLHHFFAAYYFDYLHAPALYDAEMSRLYGPAGIDAARRRLRGLPVVESPDVARFPFFEPALSGSLGVVTHSDFLLRHVQNAYPGPACKTPLPYEVHVDASPSPRESLGVPPECLILLTVGHVNPNKRVEAVLKALAADPEAARRYYYLIAGPCDPAYQKRLEALVQSLGLAGQVRFLGYVDDQMLVTCLHHADICVNLRFPAIEGASASVIEEMLCAKPVIVSDTGFYRELPDDAVCKVASSHEHRDLLATIQSLLDPTHRAAIGARALSHASSTFRADEYARRLLRFSTEVRNSRPLFELSDRLSRQLHRMGVAPRSPFLDTVSATCHELFSSRTLAASADSES